MTTRPTISYNEVYYTHGGDIGGYDNYSENSFPVEENSSLLAKASTLGAGIVGKKVLVCGCAYGFTVKYLVGVGVNAFGMDISSYAISQAPTEISNRVIVGDVRLAADFARVKSLAKITSNKKFDMIIDEDMMCCLNDADAVIYCNLMRQYGTWVIHLIDVNPHLATWYNYHTLAEWKSLVGVNDKYYARFSWSEV